MRFFRFEAYKNNGKLIEGYRQSETEAELIKILKEDMLTPRSISRVGIIGTVFYKARIAYADFSLKQYLKRKKEEKIARKETGKRIDPSSSLSLEIMSWKKDPIGKSRIASFTREMSMLLNSGIPLDKALGTISNSQTANRDFKKMLDAILVDIQKGFNLAQACARYPRIFSPEYLGLLRIGMETGRMADVMSTLANYLEREDTLYKRVKAALVYPAFVLSIALITNFAIFIFVIPQIAKILEEMKLNLPWCTRIMFMIIHMTTNPFILGVIVVIIMAVFYQLKLYIETPVGRYNLEMMKFLLPAVGSITQKLFSERFCRVMGIFFEYRADVLNSIKIIRDMFKNPYLDDILFDKMERDIHDGKDLDASLNEIPQIPRLVINLTSVGFRTGEITACLNKAAEIYEIEIEQTLQKMLTMIEPLIVGVLGLFILFIILSIFLPLYQAIGSMGT